MADFTTTTNLSLKKPAIGGSSDKWGEYINANLDTIDIEIQTLKTASSSRTLESLSNVLNLTPTTGQVLQYGIASWSATTLSIPEDVEDLSNVTVTSPSDGQVLAWSNSNSRWENQTPGAATIPNGSITSAKLSTSLQGQLNLILQTTGTPTDNQILRYDSTTANWQFEDLPGGTVSALSDTDVSSVANKDVLIYNSTSGEWVSRQLAIADVSGLQAALDAKLETANITISNISDTTITTTADDSFLVYDSTDSKWKNEGPSTVRSTLGLVIGTDVQAYDADTTKNDVSNTFSANQIISVADNTNAALRITQTGTGNALVVEDSANPDSTPFVVNSSGNVGVGTNLPGAKQEIKTATDRRLFIESADVLASGMRIESINDAGTANQGMQFNGNPFAWISNGTERMRIDSSGNIGIGTSSPGAEGLTVSKSTAGDTGIRVQNSTGAGAFVQGNFATVLAGLSTSPLSFFTNAAERMRIDSSGNVGIGTTSPAQKLDVTGNINATGALTLGTALAIAEGGTGATDAATARINLDVDQAGTDNSTDCTLVTTSHDYLSITGQAITLGPIDLAADVTGTLATSNGGTGVTSLGSLDAAELGSGSATDGYVLTADGSGGAAWEAVSGGGGGGTSYIEHSSTVSDSLAISSGTNRMYVGRTDFSSGGVTMAGTLVVAGGYANFTNASALNITGTLNVI